MINVEKSISLSAAPDRMNVEHWPSISAINSPAVTSSPKEHIRNESKLDDPNHSAILNSRPSCNKLLRQRSISSPDFRKLIIMDDDQGNCPLMPGLSTDVGEVVTPSGPSFLEKLLSKGINEEKEEIVEESPKPRIKTKPTFVVTPTTRKMRRCSMSSPNLCSMTKLEDETEILGESDAMEYYHQKSFGYNGRKNGLKMRPDEAKRVMMIQSKKERQRQAQANRGK